MRRIFKDHKYAGLGALAFTCVALVGFTVATEIARASALAQLHRGAMVAETERCREVKEVSGAKGTAFSCEKRERARPNDLDVVVDERMSDDPERWNRVLLLMGRSSLSWREKDWAKVAEFVDANGDLVDDIRGLPSLRVSFDEDEGGKPLLKRLFRTNALVDTLRADALLQARRGQSERTVDDIIAGFRIADDLLSTSKVEAHRLGHSIVRKMQKTVCDAFPPGTLSSEQTARLVDELACASHRHKCAQSFGGTALVGLRRFDEIRSSGTLAPYTNRRHSATASAPARGLFERIYPTVLGRPWLNMDEGTYATAMATLTKIAELPYCEALPEATAMDEKLAALPRTRLLSRQYLPPFADVLKQQAWHEVRVDLLRIGLLLEAHRVEHGVYPDSLGAIAGQLGGTMPVDPFSGAPYRYEAHEDDFVLYSVGLNMCDDGGFSDRKIGDIVWRARLG